MWLISVLEGWGRSLWRWRNELELGKAVEFVLLIIIMEPTGIYSDFFLRSLRQMVKRRQRICWVNMQSGPDGTCTHSGFHYRREILSLGNPNLLWWEIRLGFYSKGRLIFQGCILYQRLWKDKSGIKSCQCLSHMMCKLTRDPRRSVFHGCLKVTQLVSIRGKTGTKAAKITEMVSLVP